MAITMRSTTRCSSEFMTRHILFSSNSQFLSNSLSNSRNIETFDMLLANSIYNGLVEFSTVQFAIQYAFSILKSEEGKSSIQSYSLIYSKSIPFISRCRLPLKYALHQH